MFKDITNLPWYAFEVSSKEDPDNIKHIAISTNITGTIPQVGLDVVVCRIENSVSKKPLTEEDFDNARFIVHACNNFDKMLNALQSEDIILQRDTVADIIRQMKEGNP